MPPVQSWSVWTPADARGGARADSLARDDERTEPYLGGGRMALRWSDGDPASTSPSVDRDGSECSMERHTEIIMVTWMAHDGTKQEVVSSVDPDASQKAN